MHLACDFECTTTSPYVVYLAAIENVETGEQLLFYSMEEFMHYLSTIEPSTLYFHNGVRYDFRFIHWWCFNTGKAYYNISKNEYLVFKTDKFERTKTGRIKKHKGEPVPLEIKHKLIDTTSIFKSSIKSLGEVVGIAKGMGEVETPLVAKYDEFTWTEATRDSFIPKYITHQQTLAEAIKVNRWDEYALYDVKILAEVIRQFKIINKIENHKTTIASIAYSELLQNEEYANVVKSYDSKAEHIKNLNRIARDAYKGGISWTNPEYANQLMKTKGFHLDYTSMYPSIYMQSSKYPLPCNTHTGRKTNLHITRFKNLKCTCKPDKFPLLKQRSTVISENGQAYLHEFHGDITLTSMEVEYMLSNYTNISYDKATRIYYETNYPLMNALREHGEKWFEIKNHPKTASDRLYAKMMLNTVYGYLGFYDKEIKLYEYHFNSDTKVVEKTLTGTSVTGINTAEVPAAAFITAYGRVKLANDINMFGIENVVCCDTDSLFLIHYESLDNFQIGEDLGLLKLEHEFDEIISIKPKTYCIAKDGKVAAQALAGSNYQFKDIKNFKSGQKHYSKEIVAGVGGVGLKIVEKYLGF